MGMVPYGGGGMTGAFNKKETISWNFCWFCVIQLRATAHETHSPFEGNKTAVTKILFFLPSLASAVVQNYRCQPLWHLSFPSSNYIFCC